MRELIEHVEQLSGVILAADHADLTGLADAHSRLEKLSQLISELPADVVSSLARASTIDQPGATQHQHAAFHVGHRHSP